MQVDVARVIFRLIDLFEIGYAPCASYEKERLFFRIVDHLYIRDTGSNIWDLEHLHSS